MLQSTAIINGFLKDLGIEINSQDLQLDQQGICAFEYGNKIEFVIELPKQSSFVYFYSLIIPIPQDNREAFFHYLLTQNFFSIESQGTAFAVDNETHNITLCYSHSVEQLDLILFKNIINNLLDTADHWHDKLETFIRSCSAKPEEHEQFPNNLEHRV